MVLEILYSMLGPWSRRLIPWMVAHPEVVAGIFLLWMAFLAAGKFQLRRIETYLSDWVVDHARLYQNEHRKIDADELYQQAADAMKLQLSHLAWFIPNKTEMYPVPASMASVQRKLNFSPDWVKQQLLKNQFLSE
jgi:hypothetical protein